MEEPHRIREGIFDEHPLGITGDQLFGRERTLIGEQNGRFVVAKILDEQLAKTTAGQRDLLFIHARKAELARGDIEFDGAPGGARQQRHFLQQSRRSPPKSDKGNSHFIEARQIGVSSEAGIKNEMAGLLAVSAFPERNKVKDLIGFVAFAQIGIGITKGAARGILSQEDQNAGLASAARRHVMTFDDRMLAVIGHGMEIEIEGFAIKKRVGIHLLMPGGQHLSGFGVANAGGILRQVAFLWKGIQSRKQCQAFVGDQRHDMAVPFDGPQFEGQTTAQGLFGRDHFRSWHMGVLSQLIQLQAHQIWNK